MAEKIGIISAGEELLLAKQKMLILRRILKAGEGPDRYTLRGFFGGAGAVQQAFHHAGHFLHGGAAGVLLGGNGNAPLLLRLQRDAEHLQAVPVQILNEMGRVGNLLFGDLQGGGIEGPDLAADFLVAGGVVLLVLLVAGGLWWYMSSAAAEKEERNEQMIAEKQAKARQSIQKTIKTVQEDYADFHKFVLQSDAVVSQTVEAVQKVVPEELKDAAAEILSPPSSPAIEAAIAYTNRLSSSAGAVPPPAEEKSATTNATEAASAEKKADDKKADDKKSDEKKSDDKKADDKKSDEKKSDDKKADDKKVDEKKSDEKKSDDKKADEKKPAGKKS